MSRHYCIRKIVKKKKKAMVIIKGLNPRNYGVEEGDIKQFHNSRERQGYPSTGHV
jgi:hypothetical protein